MFLISVGTTTLEGDDMKKTILAISLFGVFSSSFAASSGLSPVVGPSTVSAWAVVATQNNLIQPNSVDPKNALYTVNVKPNGNSEVHGPFLVGELGTDGGGIFDVSPIPGTKSVLVSNFGDSKVFKVDVSDPLNPSVQGGIDLGFFAEDIAVTSDGKTALVTDGGFSPTVAFIDIPSWTLKNVFNLPAGMNAQSVAIGPDNKTVVMADYFGSKVIYGKINPTKDGLENVGSIFLCDSIDPLDSSNCLGMRGYPVNTTISPGGETAIVSLASVSLSNGDFPNQGYVGVIKLGSSGVQPASPMFVGGLPVTPVGFDPTLAGAGGNQSVAFSSGSTAWVLTQPLDPTGSGFNNRLARLTITGGQTVGSSAKVTVVDSNVAELASLGTSQLFGVDTLATYSTRFVLASNPTLSGGVSDLTLYDAGSKTKALITLPNDAIPVGIAFRP